MLFTANKMSKLGEQFNRFYRVVRQTDTGCLVGLFKIQPILFSEVVTLANPIQNIFF